MKTNIITILCLLQVLASCTARVQRHTNHGTFRNLVVKPTSELVENSYPYNDEIRVIDSLRLLTDGPEYPNEMRIPENTLQKTWEKFAELYTANNYKEAYQYVQSGENYGNILVYLRNSTAIYEFISRPYSYCLDSHFDEDDTAYYEAMEDKLLFCLTLTEAVIEMGGEDPYIPPHYLELVSDVARIMRATEDYDRAKDFHNTIYKAIMGITGDEVLAKYYSTQYRSQYLAMRGDTTRTRRLVLDLKDHIEHSYDGDDIEDYIDELKVLLDELWIQ